MMNVPSKYLLSSYQFDLPVELIAQRPVTPRESSRLMIIDRKSGHISEVRFSDIIDIVESGDSFIINNSKVYPARLFGKRETGGKVEALIVEKRGDKEALALMKPSKKLPPGTKILFEGNFEAQVLEDVDNLKHLRFKEPLDQILDKCGHIPLPPYIRKGIDEPDDRKNYQTMFAQESGSVAAPTAGLHFSSELIQKIKEKNIEFLPVCLHVGMGTFLPLLKEDIRDTKLHTEYFSIQPEVVDKLNKKNKKMIVVGTTSARTLESAADESGKIIKTAGPTNLFIGPDYNFKYVERLLTNFHLPGSSLLVLVSSFIGYELMREVYAKAIEKKFRFFSYGDAMLII